MRTGISLQIRDRYCKITYLHGQDGLLSSRRRVGLREFPFARLDVGGDLRSRCHLKGSRFSSNYHFYFYPCGCKSSQSAEIFTDFPILLSKIGGLVGELLGNTRGLARSLGTDHLDMGKRKNRAFLDLDHLTSERHLPVPQIG